MKYFISSNTGPMIRALSIKDTNAKHIGLVDSMLAELDDQEVDDLRNKGFTVVEDKAISLPNPIVKPRILDNSFPVAELDPTTPGPMKQMATTGVATAQNNGYLGNDKAFIGFTDTGVDATHPDIAANFKQFKDFADLTNTTPIDPVGHGTSCAAMSTGKGIGVAKFHGVAPNVPFAMARVFDASGMTSESIIIDGLSWLISIGVNIINMSLGDDSTVYGTLSQAVDNLANKGILVFVAAGNSGPSPIGSPGNAVSCVTCAACDGDANFATFSSVGPAVGPSGYVDKPDIMAWGENVSLARAKGTTMGNTINDLYVYADGTSFATPFMAGCGALLKSANPSLTPEEIKSLLMDTASPNQEYTKYQEGKGNVRVNDAIVKMAQPSPAPEPAPAPAPTPKPTTGCLGALLMIK